MVSDFCQVEELDGVVHVCHSVCWVDDGVHVGVVVVSPQVDELDGVDQLPHSDCGVVVVVCSQVEVVDAAWGVVVCSQVEVVDAA